MKLKLFTKKSVHENAGYYYELAKVAKKKIKGTERAIEETKKEIKIQLSRFPLKVVYNSYAGECCI